MPWSAVEKEPTSQPPYSFHCDGNKGEVLGIIVQDEIACFRLPDSCNLVPHLVAEVHDVHKINLSLSPAKAARQNTLSSGTQTIERTNRSTRGPVFVHFPRLGTKGRVASANFVRAAFSRLLVTGNLPAAAALPRTTTMSDLPTPAEAPDLFGILLFGVGRKVIRLRLVLFILSISKASLQVLLLRISALLFLFALLLLILLLRGEAQSRSSSCNIHEHWRKNCTPVLVVCSVQPKRTSRNTCPWRPTTA